MALAGGGGNGAAAAMVGLLQLGPQSCKAMLELLPRAKAGREAHEVVALTRTCSAFRDYLAGIRDTLKANSPITAAYPEGSLEASLSQLEVSLDLDALAEHSARPRSANVGYVVLGMLLALGGLALVLLGYCSRALQRIKGDLSALCYNAVVRLQSTSASPSAAGGPVYDLLFRKRPTVRESKDTA